MLQISDGKYLTLRALTVGKSFIRLVMRKYMNVFFLKIDTKGAYAQSSPRANCLHSICISGSVHNTTKHTENKREHRGGRANRQTKQ